MTPWTVARRLLCPWDFPGKNTGVGCHFLLQGDLPDSGIKPVSPALTGRFSTPEPPGKPCDRADGTILLGFGYLGPTLENRDEESSAQIIARKLRPSRND